MGFIKKYWWIIVIIIVAIIVVFTIKGVKAKTQTQQNTYNAGVANATGQTQSGPLVQAAINAAIAGGYSVGDNVTVHYVGFGGILGANQQMTWDEYLRQASIGITNTIVHK